MIGAGAGIRIWIAMGLRVLDVDGYERMGKEVRLG